MPQQWKDAVMIVLHKTKDRTEYIIYSGISLVMHACKILLKIIGRSLIKHCDCVEILQEEQSGSRPNRPTTDMTFVVPRL